jgi:dipeptidyl-peptidase 4
MPKSRYSLWAIDTAAGAQHLVVDSAKIGSGRKLSEAEKIQRERERIGDARGISTYEWAPDSQSLLVPIDGMLYQASVTTNNIAAVAPKRGRRSKSRARSLGRLCLLCAGRQSARGQSSEPY